jgi:hypothetical protein
MGKCGSAGPFFNNTFEFYFKYTYSDVVLPLSVFLLVHIILSLI